MKMSSLLTLTLGAGALLLSGCASPKVSYGDAKAVETVTNEFGSTDLQTMAEAMTRSLIQHPLLNQGQRPILTVSPVKNKTSEYIDLKAVTDSIRAQLLKSGKVQFSVDASEMANQQAEISRQSDSGLYDSKTAKTRGKMQGASYRLDGEVVSIVKTTKEVKDVYYKLSLQLVNVESGLLEWADEKDIRKTTQR